MITTLTVNPTYETPLSEVICEGESILLGGAQQTQSGIYYDTLQSINNCDSILITTLTVNPTYETPLSEVICEGESILLGGAQQTQSGTYYDTLQSINNCDSVLITTLTVNPTYETPLSEVICEGESILLGGAQQTQSGIYYDTLQSINNCDLSLIHI